MKIFYTTLAICFSIYSCVVAQVPSLTWQKTYGGSAFDQAQSILKTSDGGYIAAGTSSSTNGDVTGNHGFGDVWILKTDSTGSILWQHSYGGSGDDNAFAIKQTSDSGFIIAAATTSANGDVTFNHGVLDCWILKINSAGSIQWQKSFGGSITDIPYDILETSDHNFIFAGYSNSNDGDVTGNHGFDDFWIVRIDSTGNLIWEKSFGGSGEEHAFKIIPDGNSGYLVAGYTNSINGDVTGNNGSYDYWVIKIDSAGMLQWQRTLGGSSEDRAHALTSLQDGNFLVSGFAASSDSDVTFNHGGADLWMVKLDSAGNIQWEHSYGGTGFDQAYEVGQMNDGGIVAAGSSYSLDGDVTGNHGGYDFWLIRIDSLGAVLWDKSLGGSSVEEANSVFTSDEIIIVAGGTLSADGDVTFNHGDSDFWIAELYDPLSDLIYKIPSAGSISFFPNPFSGSTTLLMHPEKPGEVTVEIYDAIGKKVKTIYSKILSAEHHEMKIDIEDIPAGVYIANVIIQGESSVRKLIVQ